MKHTTSSSSALRLRRAALLLLACLVTTTVSAQQRNFGGGGGFGGGGFGGGGGARGGGGTAGSTSRQYYSNGTVGEAIISSDPETRRLIVITDDETSQYISQVITNLDRPKPQVLIKVVFLEVTRNNETDIGVEGALKKKIGGNTFGSISNLFDPGKLGGSKGFPPAAGLYQVLGQDFEVTLRAIQSATKAEVLSRPSILTRHSQPATITVGQTLPFITNVRYDTTGNQINTVQYQDIGIILRVTPFITSDGLVEMILSPEISDLASETVAIGKDVSAPIINKRSADTVVVTPDSQTVVIGGLLEKVKQEGDSKIPLLGDIPLLGMAFRRTAKLAKTRELMIFLTPYIVRTPVQLAGMTRDEKSNTEVAPKAFTEADLNRFVDGLPVKQPEPPASKKEKKSAVRPSEVKRGN